MTLTNLDNLCKKILERDEEAIKQAAEKMKEKHYYLVKPRLRHFQ